MICRLFCKFKYANLRVITELKEKEGKDIIVFGGPSIISELIRLHVFDEYYIAIQPMLSGGGQRLFTEMKRDRIPLDLVSMRTFEGGAVLLHYRNAEK